MLKLVPGPSEVCLWDSRYDACTVCLLGNNSTKHLPEHVGVNEVTACGCGNKHTHCGHVTVI